MLSGAQLAGFERDGYAVLGRILDEDLRAELLEVEARHRPSYPIGRKGEELTLLLAEQLCHRSAAVRRFCLEGSHLDAVAQLVGPDVAFTHTQFIAKLPSGDRQGAGDDNAHDLTSSFIPLHQDDGYGQLDPPLDVTVWTALTDTNEINGCLVIVPGSHTRGVLDHRASAGNPFLREVDGDGAVPVHLAAGEAVIFSGMTLHGSGPNRSDAVRVGMHARYCHPGVRMVLHGNQPVLDDAHSWMVRGEAQEDAWAAANAAFRPFAST
jgi:hypothetical protein